MTGQAPPNERDSGERDFGERDPGERDLGEGDVAERVEARLLDAALKLAPALGWSDRLVAAAAREAGVSEAEARLLLPGGARDLAALLWRRHDRLALRALGRVDAASLKVRERMREAVRRRVEVAVEDGEGERRAAAWLALPPHAPLALRLAWGTADALWRWAGDTATDENHYSKRAILSGVLLATATAHNARGAEAAWRTLDAQIDRVMRFEAWKARLPRPSEMAHRLAGRLGRLRYGPADAPPP
jgi:ubiquinone biosynthesis protein COQ9